MDPLSSTHLKCRNLFPVDHGKTLAGNLFYAIDGFDPDRLDESCTLAYLGTTSRPTSGQHFSCIFSIRQIFEEGLSFVSDTATPHIPSLISDEFTFVASSSRSVYTGRGDLP